MTDDEPIPALLERIRHLEREIESLADANAHAAEWLAALEEAREREALLERRGEELALQGTLDRILREERDEERLLRRVAEALSNTAALDLAEPVALTPGDTGTDSHFDGPARAVVVDGEQAAVLRFRPRHGDAVWHARWDGFLDSVSSQTSLSLHRLRAEREIERMNAVLVVARDEALEASRIKTAFLANMSHEFRTPMNAIIGYSEMLIEDADQLAPEEMLPDLRRIHASGKHLLALIDDILDLSKIEAGRMTVLSDTFDPASTIRDLATNLLPLVARNGNRLDIDAVADIGTATTDSVKFRQVLTNLIGNAAKFTENGGVSVSLSAPRAGWMRVEVADTGIGMSADQIARLFQPFVQADPSTTRKYGGTGLGLAISHHFCRMLGGDLRCASALGAGSVFTVDLPRDYGVVDASPAP